MQIKTIYIAENENMFSDCLTVNLESGDKFEVIGAASNGVTAFNEIREKKPDLVITELNLEALSGINLIRKVKATGLMSKIILLSSVISPLVIHKVLSAGVDGILLKSDQYSMLTEAISVIPKKKFLSPGISDPLVNNFLSLNSDPNSQKISPLSDREEQVAKLIGDGITSKEIAVILSISEKTVSKHRSNIFRKLNIKNTAQLVRYIYDNNLIG
ncbi:MAG: response regulator transcription factor [Gammaproteobacteria bacterium]|nr:response regulator transcription factor [Gammaproteobacteria bacterium]